VPRRRIILGVFLAFLVSAAVASPAAAKPAGFKTSQPPVAVALAPNVMLDPILTAGDVIGSFQATGVMDGLGFYRSSKSSVELLMDHELADFQHDPNNATDTFDARVTHLTLSNPGRITGAEYALDGSEGFIWFCSGNLTVLDGTPWFFTGEEDQNYFSPHGGTTIAIDATDPSTYQVLDHFGFMAHEQELPILGLDEATFILPEDNPGTAFPPPNASTSNVSQLYAYTATDWASALDGTGQLGVFVPDGTFLDGNPSTNDIHKGETITGHFEPLDQATDNANQRALEAAAQAAGGFDFVRLEDVAQSKTEPGVAYFADTGRRGRETLRGRVYRLALDPADPTQATLSVLLDGDDGDPIINPDNLGASPKALIIQEDRNSEHRFPAGVGSSLLHPGDSPFSLMYVYSFANGKLRAVARPDTLASLIPTFGQGDWETSGMTDASSLWGKGWWLFDVQMHHTSVGQPDTLTMTPDGTTGENAQLLRIYIPGT
jgi:hypothetical protein